MFQPIDDSELDRLSRDASQKFTVPGKPNWEAMRNELDLVMPVKERKRRFLVFWWLGPLLLASGGWLYWHSLHTASLNHSSENRNKQVPVITSNSLSKTKSEQKNPELVINSHSLASPRGMQKNPIQNNSVTANPGQGNTASKSVPPISGYSASTLPEANSLQEKPFQAEKGTMAGLINSGSAEKNTISDINKNTLQNSPANLNPTQSHDSVKQSMQISAEPASTKNAETTVSDSMDNKNLTKKAAVVKLVSGKGFSYSILAGIDKSTVKYTHDDHPGYNLGIEIGYHFNRHWSVQTGAVYTQKKYTVSGSDFNPPKGSWASYYHFDQIDGYCRMWEIPLLVRYQPGTERKPSRFAFSTGLSSYFMTRENYTYYYQYNGQALSRTNNYPSSDTHLLSVWHLSAEYSSPLSKKWSLGIEPYAKLPLGGVGFGQIRLSSFGINLILRHKQSDRK